MNSHEDQLALFLFAAISVTNRKVQSVTKRSVTRFLSQDSKEESEMFELFNEQL